MRIKNTDFANSRGFVWIFLFSKLEKLVLDFLLESAFTATVELPKTEYCI